VFDFAKLLVSGTGGNRWEVFQEVYHPFFGGDSFDQTVNCYYGYGLWLRQANHGMSIMLLSSFLNVAAKVAENEIKRIISILKALHRLLTLTGILKFTQIPVLAWLIFLMVDI
jgi:hypothetical protein